jgi:putative Ca2+/H+ antiporter (TMEM165/GDT1 family)
MFLETFASVFITVFLAELGDKTQLATLTFSAENPNRLAVFLGSAGALTLAALIGVLVGSQLERFISPEKLKIVAGVGFIVIGIWTLWRG